MIHLAIVICQKQAFCFHSHHSTMQGHSKSSITTLVGLYSGDLPFKLETKPGTNFAAKYKRFLSMSLEKEFS
ncbi:hypothetical protein HanPSC8_Chr01g0023631 [Helianthus annuus]|nr:hypothetical protein HanPSC8_Chr01g0023631 [Helianthus annuus]